MCSAGRSEPLSFPGSGSLPALITVQIYSVFGYTLGCILVWVYKFPWEPGQEQSVCVHTQPESDW